MADDRKKRPRRNLDDTAARPTESALWSLETGPLWQDMLPGSALLAEGEILADRFRVVGLIGRGGMGEVYEAADLELGENVAIKALRAAANEPAVERFREEIRLARRVTHPNVCRTFDVFRHVELAPDGTPREVLFVSMEPLTGETLAKYLRRERRLDLDEALPLALQMTAALGAAHRAGIVHGDFKCANVILVKPGYSEGTRAVVTDFGLARTATVGTTAARGELVGTPAYLAPERLLGSPLTPASDIYSLGVVLFEMVTGTPPFLGPTPWATAEQRLERAAPSPRGWVPDLDPRWERAILRCLERAPQDRFPSPDDVGQALTAAIGKRAATPERRRRARRLSLALGVSVVAGGVAVTGVLLRPWAGVAPRSGPSVEDARPLPSRRSAAVLGFANLSRRPEDGWISTAFSEMLATEIAAGGGLRTIPGENVARMEMDLNLNPVVGLSPETLAAARVYLGTDLLISGAYLVAGPRDARSVRFDVRAQDARTGASVAMSSEAGPLAELPALAGRSGARLRAALAVGEPGAKERATRGAVFPKDPEAARLYAEGLARLRVQDAQAARPLLEQAISIEPDHPLPHVALSSVWNALGMDDRALAESRRALALCESLPAEERLAIEARYHVASRDLTQATARYRQLFQLFPDDLEHGLDLAETLTVAGHPKEALDVVSVLRRLPRPLSDDPRIDLAEADAARRLADLPLLLAAAERAIAKAEARGARFVAARAHLRLGWALLDQGQQAGAVAAFRKAQRLYDRAGDAMRAARALNQIGLVEAQSGHWRAAFRIFEEVRETSQARDDRRYELVGRGNAGVVLGRRGQIARALAGLRPALQDWLEFGDERGHANLAADIASLETERGELDRAQRRYERTLKLSRERGFRATTADCLTGLGRVLLLRGDLSGARARLEEASQLCRRIDERTCGPALAARATLEEAGDRAEVARRDRNEALRLAEVGAATGLTAVVRLGSALSLLTADEDPSLALRLAHDAQAYFVEQGVDNGVAQAEALAAWALARQGRHEEARAVLAGARGRLDSCEPIEARLVVALATARVALLSHETARARGVVGPALALAAGRHAPLELELRLTDALLATTGERTPALEAVEKAARARGFLWLARRAAQAAPGASRL